MSKGNIGIYVGAPDTKTVVALKESILEILEAKADQKTIQLALKIMAVGVKNNKPLSINNCHITMVKDDEE